MSGRLSRSAASCCRSLHANVARSTGTEARTLSQHRVASPAAPSAASYLQLLPRRTYATTPSSYAVPPPQSKKTDTESATSAAQAPISDISKQGFSDKPLPVANPTPSSSTSASADPAAGEPQVDWTRSYHGLSTEPFSAEAAAILQAPLEPEDVEIKPDGIIYLPEIKYRRILNKAFGPGGWGLAPRGETIVTGKAVTREYALVVLGRLVSIARGEQDYFSADGIPTATEGCRSNALLRCCKDLGVASELWDPRFIRDFMKKHVKEVWVEHVTTKKKKKIFIRKDAAVTYPFKETKA